MTTAETRQQRRHKARQEAKGIAVPQKNAFHRALTAFKMRAEALQAAMAMGPIAAKLALMDLSMKLGAYKSRGKGKGNEGRNYMRPYTNARKPHASGQECLRRAVGGWGFRKRLTGLTKRETLQLLAPHGRIPLERAIAIVRGLDQDVVPAKRVSLRDAVFA